MQENNQIQNIETPMVNELSSEEKVKNNYYSMTVDEFNNKKDYIIYLINQSKSKNNFTYSQKYSNYPIQCTVKITE